MLRIVRVCPPRSSWALSLAGLGLGRGPVAAHAGGAQVVSSHRSLRGAQRAVPGHRVTRPCVVERARRLGARRRASEPSGSRGAQRDSPARCVRGRGRHAPPVARRGSASPTWRIAWAPTSWSSRVAAEPSGSPQKGEATHPAWSARAISSGRWAPACGSARRRPVRRLAAPVRAERSSRRCSAPRTRSSRSSPSPTRFARPEDERLSNLWRYDRPTGRWRAVTRFPAARRPLERHPHARRPRRRHRGVRPIAGVGRRARLPAFPLWRRAPRPGTPESARSRGERYLAGVLGGGGACGRSPTPRRGVAAVRRVVATGSRPRGGSRCMVDRGRPRRSRWMRSTPLRHRRRLPPRATQSALRRARYWPSHATGQRLADRAPPPVDGHVGHPRGGLRASEPRMRWPCIRVAFGATAARRGGGLPKAPNIVRPGVFGAR